MASLTEGRVKRYFFYLVEFMQCFSKLLCKKSDLFNCNIKLLFVHLLSLYRPSLTGIMKIFLCSFDFGQFRNEIKLGGRYCKITP